MISRRDVLRAMLTLPLAATVDVEQLLWMPRPMIVVPALPPTLLTPSWLVYRELSITLEQIQRIYERTMLPVIYHTLTCDVPILRAAARPGLSLSPRPSPILIDVGGADAR